MTERVLLAPGLAFTRVAGEGIVLDETHGQVHVLNRAAARMWEMLESGTDLDSVVAQLASGTDAPATQVRADVLTVLGEMAELGLLHDPPPAM